LLKTHKLEGVVADFLLFLELNIFLFLLFYFHFLFILVVDSLGVFSFASLGIKVHLE